MALITSACILLAISSYVAMPNIKRYEDISLGPGREGELEILGGISNVPPTFTYNMCY